MSQIKELHRGLLNYHLRALNVKRSELPVIGIKQTEISGEDKGEQYFVLTEDRFGIVDVESSDVGRVLIQCLVGRNPQFYDQYRSHFYLENEEINNYRPLNPEEIKSLQELLN